MQQSTNTNKKSEKVDKKSEKEINKDDKSKDKKKTGKDEFGVILLDEAPYWVWKRSDESNNNIEYYDINSFLCREKCSPYDDKGNVLYFDKSHLEIQASWKIGKELFESGKMPELFKSLIHSR